MSAEPPIGSFFAVSLEEIHEIAEKSGNADCVLAMIALRRGKGKKKNTGWGRLSIKKHMALPHSRVNNAIDWLLENRYFVEGKRDVKSKGKSLGEGQTEAKGKEHLFPVRTLSDIGKRKWIFLPNSLVDNVDGGKEGGLLGQLMRNIRTAPWSKISTDQARVDAMLVLIALYKQHQGGKTRKNLVWWLWETETDMRKAMSLTTSANQELCLLAATKGALQFDPEAATEAFGSTCPSYEILPRLTLAVENLKALGLAYTLTSVCRRWLDPVGKGKLEPKYDLAYALASDFNGLTQPLGVPLLKELVAYFSEHLKQKPGAHLFPTFNSESIEFVSLRTAHVVRSTLEPVHVPNTEDLIEISAELNVLRKYWSKMIEDAMDNDLILH